MENLSKKEQTKLSIMQSAIGVFCRYGFASSKISDIAKNANIGKGTVYEHFKSKEELLLSCCLAICKEKTNGLKDTIETSSEPIESSDNPAKIFYHSMVSAIEIIPAAVQEHMQLFMDLRTAAKTNNDLMLKTKGEMQALWIYWEEYSVSVYKACVKKKQFRNIKNIKIFGNIITAIIDGWIWQLFFREDLDMKKTSHETANMFLELLLTDKHTIKEVLK